MRLLWIGTEFLDGSTSSSSEDAVCGTRDGCWHRAILLRVRLWVLGREVAVIVVL